MKLLAILLGCLLCGLFGFKAGQRAGIRAGIEAATNFYQTNAVSAIRLK